LSRRRGVPSGKEDVIFPTDVASWINPFVVEVVSHAYKPVLLVPSACEAYPKVVEYEPSACEKEPDDKAASP
jgi:hypothetical protein